MKRFKSLLLANAVLYTLEGGILWAWVTFWPFSFHTYWAVRLGMLH